MSLLDPAPCIYAKTIVYELFSNNNGPKSLLGIYETVCWYSLRSMLQDDAIFL